jgi:hypothetical protein
MSGGHFNYDQHRCIEIAETIEQLIQNNDRTDKDEYGSEIGYHFSPEVIAKFAEAVPILKRAYRMAHRIDWLVSGDEGEDSFLRRWDEDGL